MDPRVTVVIGVMHESLAHHVSIRMLSKIVNLSPTRLRQLFERDTARSPMQYLRELRMQRAEHLLTSTFLSVKEVAFCSGAKHVSSFVHAFKRHHSITPSEFRIRSAQSLNPTAN